MELLIVLGYIVIPAAAVLASCAFSGDADSSMGDGMILGCLLLAHLPITNWLTLLGDSELLTSPRSGRKMSMSASPKHSA